MILIIGDTHGDIDGYKLESEFVYKTCGDRYPDYVIINGDFGYIWGGIQNEEEYYNLSSISERPWITLFLDGNHENHPRLQQLPVIEMFNSSVGKVTDKIFHLKRGNIYTIENKTFFVLGGAASIDKEYRQAYISWWPEELPTNADYNNAISNLEKVNYTVDYVLTHTCPREVKEKLDTYKIDFNDPTEVMLSDIANKTTFKKWFFGHFHMDKEIVINSVSSIDGIVSEKKYQCLYERGFIIE